MERDWYCTFHLVVTVGKTIKPVGATLGLRYQADNCIFNYIDKNILFYDEVSELTVNADGKACAFLEYKPRLVLVSKNFFLSNFNFFYISEYSFSIVAG